MYHFYTYGDLLQEDFRLHEPKAKLAVIGNPIAHSKSPQMQQAALCSAGIDATYIRVLAEDHEFEGVVSRLRELKFIGANVTVPFKKRACTLATSVDQAAAMSGSVNTLVFSNEDIKGFNTDGAGFSAALREATDIAPPLRGRHIVLLGAGGGAGSTLACQCALEGCASLVLVNRTIEKIHPLSESINRQYPNVSRCLSTADTTALMHAVRKADLLIQATSLGLRETDPLPLPKEALHKNLTVCDIITHDTPLLRLSREQGLCAIGGGGMLMYQGACAFRLWFPDKDPNLTAMRHALVVTEQP